MASDAQKQKNVAAFEAAVGAAHRTGRGIAPLDDTYSFAPITPAAGRWCFVTTCGTCQQERGFFWGVTRACN